MCGKALVAKPDNLIWAHKESTKGKEKTESQQLTSDLHMWLMAFMHAPMNTHTEIHTTVDL